MDLTHTDVVYLCDGKACGSDHECMECKHTSDISHAVNFEKIGGADKYFEMNQTTEQEQLANILNDMEKQILRITDILYQLKMDVSDIENRLYKLEAKNGTTDV